MINLDLSIARARVIANDNKYGYSQTRRDEEFEGDCSSNTVDCLNAGGFNFSLHLTTDTMLKPLLAAGFVDVTKSVDLVTGKGLLPADVCLRPKTKTRGGHVILVLREDGAEIFQNAGDFDGKRGDSSGKEILVQRFYNSPFKYVLRYMAKASATHSASAPANPYTEPTRSYIYRTLFRGNDAGWFETELNRIGYTWDRMGCDNNPDEDVGPMVWNLLVFEIGQGRNMGMIKSDGNTAGPELRAYLKGCTTKK